MPEITSLTRMDQLERLIRFVAGHAETAGFPIDRIKEIELAAEEVLVNIFSYAYPEMEGRVSITCMAEDDARLVLVFSDNGVPFNMLALPDPDLTEDISHRHIGGLGVFFVKTMADTAQYRREGDRNILKLIFDRHPRGTEEEDPPDVVKTRRGLQHGRNRI
jgi:serine/threonine-protein kinase RsbW